MDSRVEKSGDMEFVFEQCCCGLKKVWTFFTNILSLEHDMNSLTEKRDELQDREHDVMAVVKTEEEKPGRKRRREVTRWLRSVKRFKREVHDMQERLKNERGWISRYHLTNQISEMKIKAVQLQNKSGFPDGLAIDWLGISSPQPLATLQGESANTAFTSILTHLSDGVGKVAVFGMPGVGKTIILKNIYTTLKGLGVFKNIIWVTATKARDLHELQREIAVAIQLGLSNGWDNQENISLKLHAEFSRRESCLLILDDLWKPFSLDSIGIPEPNSTNGFKLAITTSSLMVCKNMESEKIVNVGLLSAEEAWDLFKEKVGGDVLDSSEIKPIAERIVKECGCLPSAIIAVGRRLRGAGDTSIWRNAQREFRHSNTDMYGMDEVFDRLKISYTRLSNDGIRDCFLYYASYPEDYEMSAEQLIEAWLGNGLIGEVGNVEQKKDMGYAILRELIGACMIYSNCVNLDDKPRVVKLHHLMRHLAICITTSPRS